MSDEYPTLADYEEDRERQQLEIKEAHLYELGHSKDCVERMLEGDGCSCLCNGDTAGL